MGITGLREEVAAKKESLLLGLEILFLARVCIGWTLEGDWL